VLADEAVFNGESDGAVPGVAGVVSPWTTELSDVDMRLRLLDNAASDGGEEEEGGRRDCCSEEGGVWDRS